MTIRMLIDSTHEEETRVAIVHGNRVEEFDYESSAKKQIKGNIYLAKVTRVEPSLQAAFVEYGGNRHGFLAFSEIHPDYYQIPVADREALIAEEKAAYATILDDEEEPKTEKPRKRSRRRSRGPKQEEVQADSKDPEAAEGDAEAIETAPESSQNEDDVPADNQNESPSSMAESVAETETVTEKVNMEEESHSDDQPSYPDEEEPEVTGSLEIDEEEAEASLRIKIAKGLRHKYKIQEVIKKNQILLIQVVKEERGNKGAALTTYMSLPGRYCVLMPNTLHGGGVSRKIANAGDRKSLKKILSDLNMPSGMACIIRTAGHSRTKTEIKRDFDYLIRTWEGIRERTLKSVAPVMINEEGDLIKRSIRDLYTREIDEILVEGEQGYKTARSFMKLLMPSHARKIKHYTDPIPLLHRYQVESQLDSMFSPVVQLKSGGYIVINPTEALVSIDVNSGKATKERNIEETAKKTNLEAAEEVARQLRLRDMAGLVVIDFIDMEIRGNNRAVEQRLKECLKTDRARIQVGRISSFGLLEMSRQRLRSGVLESSTRICPHCDGAGVIRSVETQVLHIIRTLEEEGIRARNDRVILHLPEKTALYLLNNKRVKLASLEEQYSFAIEIVIDSSLTESGYRIELPSSEQKNSERQASTQSEKAPAQTTQRDERSRKRDDDRANSRRNRQRNQNRRHGDSGEDKQSDVSNDGDENEVPLGEANASSPTESKPRRRRRRSRRGNKQDGTNESPVESGELTEKASPETKDEGEKPEVAAEQATSESPSSEAPKRRKRTRSRSKSEDKAPKDEGAKETHSPSASETESADKTEPTEKKTTRRPYPPQARGRKKAAEKETAKETSAEDKKTTSKTEKVENKQDVPPAPVEKPVDVKKAEDEKPPGPKKTGWWQRTFG